MLAAAVLVVIIVALHILHKVAQVAVQPEPAMP
jgi:hypothetical protein